MAVHDPSASPSHEPSSSHLFGDDRHCRHCHEVALAFDPSADRPRCRSCGELA